MAGGPAPAAVTMPSAPYAPATDSPQCGSQCTAAFIPHTLSATAPAATTKSSAGARRERVQPGGLSGGTSRLCTKMNEHRVDETRSIVPIISRTRRVVSGWRREQERTRSPHGQASGTANEPGFASDDLRLWVPLTRRHSWPGSYRSSAARFHFSRAFCAGDDWCSSARPTSQCARPATLDEPPSEPLAREGARWSQRGRDDRGGGDGFPEDRLSATTRARTAGRGSAPPSGSPP